MPTRWDESPRSKRAPREFIGCSRRWPTSTVTPITRLSIRGRLAKIPGAWPSLSLRLCAAWKKMARWPPRSISPATEIPARIHTSICPLSAEVAVRSILAGVDVLLVPPAPEAALAALADAIASGRIPKSRIDEAVTRVLRAKARLGLHKQKLVDLNAIATQFGRPEFLRQAQDIADRGVTLLRDAPHMLPLDATRPMRVLLVVISGDSDPYPGEDLERESRWRVDSLEVVRTDTKFTKVETVTPPPPDRH